MSEKSALFMARTTRFHEFARSLTTTLGVEVSPVSYTHLRAHET